MKRGYLLGAAILLVVLVSGLVAAQDANEIITGVQGVFTPFLESIFGSSGYVFEEFLFAIVIIAFVYMALSQIEAINDKAWVVWLITLAVAILGVRFIATEKFTEALLFPQGVLGVTLLVAIPFVIVFWFVEFGLEGPRNRVLRKICWVIFAAVFVFLWFKQFYVPAHYTTSSVLSSIFTFGATSAKVPASIESWGYLYLMIVAASIILLLADNTIQSAIRKSSARSRFEVNRVKLQAALMQERKELEEKRINGTITSNQYTTLDNDLKDREKHAGLRS